jgi:hypothetical protein
MRKRYKFFNPTTKVTAILETVHNYSEVGTPIGYGLVSITKCL